MTIPQFVAHRGDCQFGHENTLASVQGAIEHGCLAVEIDVQLTKDGVPVLFHDRDLKRMANQQGAIYQLTLAELSQISLSDPDKSPQLPLSNICLLSDVVNLLANYPEVTLFVEVKRINFKTFTHRCVAKIIDKILSPIKIQVVTISFSYRFLRAFKQQHTTCIGYVLPTWAQYNDKLLNKLQPEYLFCDIDFAPSGFCYRQTGYKWVIYDVGSTRQAQYFIDSGAQYLESYFPYRLSKQLDQLNVTINDI